MNHRITAFLRFLTAGLFFSTLLCADESAPLEYWLADNAPFWSWDSNTFEQNVGGLGFRWMDENKTAARAAPLSKPFFGQDAYETVIRFADGIPDNVMISYYNRGDATRPMSEDDFQAMVRTLMTKLTETLRVQPRPGSQKSNRSDVRDDSRIWQRPKIQFELSYSYSPPSGGRPFISEYVRLTVRKFSAGEVPAFANTTVNPYEIKTNITRDPASGDVWIENIPMVDQGPKGYCAAATSERILRFFGQEVDQHQIAQIANTTSGGGTSSAELKKALHAVGRQYDFNLSTHIEWDWGDFQKTIERYNRNARKNGSAVVHLDRSQVINLSDIYVTFDPETYKATKLSRRSDYNKFQEKVKKYVNAGCPLAWSVRVGMFPESTPTGTGGHLRMIIGYNTQKDEIIYSDTWGRGHEKKSMSTENAFTITNSLFSLEPKGLRL
ncbi:C39 family peptidase [Kiritimatiellaeota bacterium B1221]|nr:C39 family peptidase [Kiritimatiellaeota bacterium B1221]